MVVHHMIRTDTLVVSEADQDATREGQRLGTDATGPARDELHTIGWLRFWTMCCALRTFPVRTVFTVCSGACGAQCWPLRHFVAGTERLRPLSSCFRVQYSVPIRPSRALSTCWLPPAGFRMHLLVSCPANTTSAGLQASSMSKQNTVMSEQKHRTEIS